MGFIGFHPSNCSNWRLRSEAAQTLSDATFTSNFQVQMEQSGVWSLVTWGFIATIIVFIFLSLFSFGFKQNIIELINLFHNWTPPNTALLLLRPPAHLTVQTVCAHRISSGESSKNCCFLLLRQTQLYKVLPFPEFNCTNRQPQKKATASWYFFTLTIPASCSKPVYFLKNLCWECYFDFLCFYCTDVKLLEMAVPVMRLNSWRNLFNFHPPRFSSS